MFGTKFAREDYLKLARMRGGATLALTRLYNRIVRGDLSRRNVDTVLEELVVLRASRWRWRTDVGDVDVSVTMAV